VNDLLEPGYKTIRANEHAGYNIRPAVYNMENWLSIRTIIKPVQELVFREGAHV